MRMPIQARNLPSQPNYVHHPGMSWRLEISCRGNTIFKFIIFHVYFSMNIMYIDLKRASLSFK
jgi:hypothetical protein